MIILSRLNDTQFYVNPHQIEFMEETPDTVITMLSGKKLVVKDKSNDIIKKIIDYRQSINRINETNIIREHL